MQRPTYLGVDLEPDGIDVGSLHEVLSDCLTSGRLPKFIYVAPDFQNASGLSMPQNVDTRQLFHTALKFKVAFVPGEAFYGEQPERHHICVNFSYPSAAQLREAVKRLSDCLRQQGI